MLDVVDSLARQKGAYAAIGLKELTAFCCCLVCGGVASFSFFGRNSAQQSSFKEKV